MNPALTIKEKIRHSLHLERALRLVWQSAPGWTIANFGLILIQGLLPLVSLYLMKLIVDAVTGGLAAQGKPEALQRVLLLVVIAAAAALFAAACRSLAEMVKEAQTQVITDHVADVIHGKSVAVDLEYYEDPRYYDTLHRAQQEATYRPASIMNSLMQLGQSSISLVALAGLLVSFHWWVAAMLFAATVPGVLLRLKYAHRMYGWQRQHTQVERRAAYFHWMLTDGGHAKEIRLFGLGPLFMDWFRELRRKLRVGRLKLSARRSLADLTTQTSATLAIFGTLALVAYQAVKGTITIGDMVMYYGAFQRAQTSLQEVWSGLTRLYEDNLFLANFSEFLDLQPRLAAPPIPAAMPRPIKQGFFVEKVNFHYPTGDRTVLEDISLRILPGQVVALVGENGSGKTTLIKLLSRLYDPVSGRITIDGTDLRQFDPKALREEVSVIFQDYAHYWLTARENIWLGDISLSPRDDKIYAAARQTRADDFIQMLPRGYDTVLGHEFEDQGELSLGEWQKVALARAFLRQSRLIILDEPTSWMDARAEYEVFKSFRQLFQGRMVLLISHRFSTVRLADYIYVLEGGRLTESGTHDELVRQAGKYAHLYEIQAASYR
ncbi:MAG: ABC transporter ATP-binding protein/permease [Deltaproteobacteria bacterium]|nr:ABC transporter ATP-binding protein/permease [Deltaproteobacteria bacterium]